MALFSNLKQTKPYLYYFEQLTQIPHGSKNEKAISDYIVDFAKSLSLDVYQDELFNVYVYKPAQHSQAKDALILQGHLDMVCEKLGDIEHNFETDGLNLYVEDNWLKARGTTLGADDGMAIAYMMAILENKEMAHPPLECLFTTQEEIGLFGAYALEASRLSAKKMINLDCGPQGVAVIGSAGGCQVDVSEVNTNETAIGVTYHLKIRGLQGGHSGGAIDKERGNAILMAGRFLMSLHQEHPIRVVSIQGGDKDNAIPRECDAVFCADHIDQSLVDKLVEDLNSEYHDTETQLHISLEQVASVDQMMTKRSSDKLLNFLTLCLNGVVKKSISMPGLVLTSTNLGVIKTTPTTWQATLAMRSAAKSTLDDIVLKTKILCEVLDLKCTVSAYYPAWELQVESELRTICDQVYQRLTNEPLKFVAVHGGLECGVIKEKMPDLDIVALGPNAKGAHTPEEALDLESFDWVWGYLLAILKTLSE